MQAIHQDEKGGTLIVGDQTGVGKGRVVALKLAPCQQQAENATMSDGFRKWSERESERSPEPALKDNSLWVAVIVFAGAIGLVVAGDFAYGAWTKRQNQAKEKDAASIKRVVAAGMKPPAPVESWDTLMQRATADAEVSRILEASSRKAAEEDERIRLEYAAKLRLEQDLRQAQREAAKWQQRAKQAQQAAEAAKRSHPASYEDWIRVGGRPEFHPGYIPKQDVGRQIDLREELRLRELMRQGQEFYDSFDK